MEIPHDIASAIHDEFHKAQNILFLSHRNPDGDSVGSNLALRLLAIRLGKKTASICPDKLHPKYGFLHLTETFATEFNPEDFDLLVSVDCGSMEQTGFPKDKLLSKDKKFINIDHHPSNGNYGNINLVMENAASTTIIIFHLLKEWKEDITPEMATCLLAGIYTDTGSFMHSNTCDEVYEAAGELIALGASQNLIVKNLFKQSSHEKMHLLGKILGSVNMTDKKVVISALREQDFIDCGTDSSEMGGAIDYLNSVKGNRIAALLTEDGKGNIRGSLRTRHEDINLTSIAEGLGGGGHRKASGFTMKGHLQKEVRWTILPD